MAGAARRPGAGWVLLLLAALAWRASGSGTPTCSVLDGTNFPANGTGAYLKVGVAASLTGKYQSAYGEGYCRVLKMWADLVASEGGIELSGSPGTRVGVSFAVEDANSPPVKTQVGPAVDALQARGVHVVVSPYSSTLTPFAAEAALAHGLPVVAPGAASSSVYRCPAQCSSPADCAAKRSPCTSPNTRRFSNLFGLFAPGEQYFRSIVDIVFIAGARTACIIREDLAFPYSTASGALARMAEVQMKLLCPEILIKVDAGMPAGDAAITSLSGGVIVTGGDWDAVADAAVAYMQESGHNPDLVLGAVYYSSCVALLRAMRRRKWFPKATALSVCVGNPKLPADVGPDARWILGPAQWDMRLGGSEYRESPSETIVHYFTTGAAVANNATTEPPAVFSEAYERQWGVRPSYQMAGCMGAAYMLQAAVAAGGSTSVGMERAMAQVHTTSFWGYVTTDATGSNNVRNVVSLQYDEGAEARIVYPVNAASYNPTSLVYPAPAYDDLARNPQCPRGYYYTGEARFCTDAELAAVAAGTLAADPFLGTGWCNTTCVPCGLGKTSPEEGASECTVCPNNTVATAEGTAECAACPAGQYADDSRTACVPCPPGTHRTEADGICEPCPPGHYQELEGQTSCLQCGPGTFAARGGLPVCDACPAHTLSQQGSSRATDCVCEEGYYLPSGGNIGDACVTCEGLLCDGVILPAVLGPALFLLLVSILAICVMHVRRVRKQKQKQSQEHAKATFNALASLTPKRLLRLSSDLARETSMTPGEGVTQLPEICFVVTDLMDSTVMAAADPAAFRKLQSIHDDIMRAAVRKYGAYEIATQGDSFELAFADCDSAALFCLDVQQTLVDVDWPKAVLKLPSCKARVDNVTGLHIFRGPKVRMGMHFGKEGTFQKHVHDLTRTTVYLGEAFQVTQQVSDAANGGQVLLTDDTCAQLSHRNCMYPTLESLGDFRLALRDGSKDLHLFQLHPGFVRPLPWRMFDQRTLRGIESLDTSHGSGLDVWEFRPVKEVSEALCVVRVEGSLSASASALTQRIVMAVAQSFRGQVHVALHNNTEAVGTAVQLSTLTNAIRFAAALQAVAVHAPWEAGDCKNVKYDAKGALIERGVRFSAAVHVCPVDGCGELTNKPQVVENFRFQAQSSAASSSTSSAGIARLSRQMTLNYERESVWLPNAKSAMQGPMLDFVWGLCESASPGQTVLTQRAWEALQREPINMGVQFLDIGTYDVSALGREGGEVSGHEPREELVMDVAVYALQHRRFKRLGLPQLRPGFYEAPDPALGVAIVFCKAMLPAGTPEEDVATWSALCRDTLSSFGGYWCKEVDGGKFTLAFRTVPDAMGFCLEAQRRLVRASWTPELLAMEGCGAVGTLWRGLRVAMAGAYGHDCFKKPLQASGRADYFGALANMAARCMGQAVGGQVLFRTEPNEPWVQKLSGPKVSSASRNLCIDRTITIGGAEVTLKALGRAELKGIGGTAISSVVSDCELRFREFPPMKNLITDKPLEGGGTGGEQVMRMRKFSSQVTRPILNFFSSPDDDEEMGYAEEDKRSKRKPKRYVTSLLGGGGRVLPTLKNEVPRSPTYNG